MAQMVRVCETSMSLLGEYRSSKSYFWRRKKDFLIRGDQEIIDLLKIEFNFHESVRLQNY